MNTSGGQGFRDLEESNEALLAKQLRRILTRPNLLLSKILRGKYFKGKTIWETNLKNGDSWCWRSILSAKDLLQKGIRKRVGDGKTIDIWKDKWLADSTDGKMSSGHTHDTEFQWVSELIRNGEWDEDTLGRIFDEEDRKSN